MYSSTISVRHPGRISGGEKRGERKEEERGKKRRDLKIELWITIMFKE